MIEGKDQDNGFEAAVRDDFKNRIIPNLRYSNIVSPIQILNKNQAKVITYVIKTVKTHA